jgi:hypothetical protein
MNQEKPIEERWHNPDQCDLCGKITPNPWTWDTFPTGAFTFCKECNDEREAECDTLIAEAVAEFRKMNGYAEEKK